MDHSEAIAHMEAYFQNFLEVSRDGFPICPFVKASREAGLLRWFVGDLTNFLVVLAEAYAFCLQQKHTALLCLGDRPIALPKLEEVASQMRSMVGTRLLVFSHHPDDLSTHRGLLSHRTPYPCLLLVEQGVMREARDTLQDTGYYR